MALISKTISVGSYQFVALLCKLSLNPRRKHEEKQNVQNKIKSRDELHVILLMVFKMQQKISAITT